MQTIKSQKPIIFGEILREAWEIYTREFKFFLGVTLAIFTPIFLLQAILEQFIFEKTNPEFIPTNLPSLINALTKDDLFIAEGIFSIVLAIVGVGASAAVMLGVKRAREKKELVLGELVREGFGKWWSLLWVSIIQGILTILLFGIFIIPGIIYLVKWIFAGQTVVLTEKRGYASLKYSKELIRGRWWEIFGRFLLIIILVGGAVIIFSSATARLTEVFPLANALVFTITQIIATYASIFLTLYFLHLQE